MTPASYIISGAGPSSATFKTTITSGTADTETSLAVGLWTITVDAYNNSVPTSGTKIGSGSTTVTVTAGNTATATVTVTPIVGKGELDLTANWTASQVTTPVVTATLTPPGTGATVVNLNSFSAPTSSSGIDTATSNTTGLNTGYSTLALTLTGSNISEMGAVEVVRIVNGQTTTGSYTLAANQAGGAIQVNITPDMLDALQVGITNSSGGTPGQTIASGASESLTAAVSNYTGTVTYVWYVNGQSVFTGSSYAFTTVSHNPNLNGSPYTYRIDVTAFTSDGTQAGSTTLTQTVNF
jgi:hypothetical protein